MSKPFDMVLAELDFLQELLEQDAEGARATGDQDEAEVRSGWAVFVGEVKDLLDEQRQRLTELLAD